MRLRSSSTLEGEKARRAQVASKVLQDQKDRLFRLATTVFSRCNVISTSLEELEKEMEESGGSTSTKGPEEELHRLQALVMEAEEREAETWMLAARVGGDVARRERAVKWTRWQREIQERLAGVRGKLWRRSSEVRPASGGLHHSGCGRAAGHVEKVRLLVFSGQVEEWTDFRSEFQQLCNGEKYSPVVELAQLRHKIPKEAVVAITGLSSPAVAWARLEEMYGDRELMIVSALQRLRRFRMTKHAEHEQVIELATAIQRCCTTLDSLDARRELYHDRESMAIIVNFLPPESRGLWFRRKGREGEGPVERAERLLDWVEEEERKTSVAIRLNEMTRKLQSGSTVGLGVKKPAVPALSTEDGLHSTTFLAQQVPKGPPGEESVTALSAGGGDSGGKVVPASSRLEITTKADADSVTSRRKTNMEAKKLDVCPLCKAVHYFSKMWPKVSPEYTTKMLST